MDYKTIISKKRSVRNYKQHQIDDKVFDELRSYYKNHKKLMDNIDIQIIVKSKDEVYHNLKGFAGYNNILLEAPHYMFILSEEKDNYIENTGYIAEGIMVKAYDLNVGSCWISFDDGEIIKEKLSIKSDKKLSGIISFGNDDNKIKILHEPKAGDLPSKADIDFEEDNVTIRLDVEDVVFMGDWGCRADADELQVRGLLDAFNFARFAPSTLNKQPWRFIVDDEFVILVLKKDDHISEYSSKIDAGIVMLYFDLIVNNSLKDTTWQLEKPDKNYNIPDDFSIVGYCTI